MRGKRTWLLLTLLLVCTLAVGLSLLAGGGNDRQAKPERKMPDSLWQLSMIYEEFGVQKLSQIRGTSGELGRATALDPGKKERLFLLEELLAPEAGEISEDRPIGKNEIMKSGNKLLDKLVDPVVQKRWHNPSFDVARGVITSPSDPRDLGSSHLKIRRAWEKDGKWKAFCEFAVYKAREIAEDARIDFLALLPTPELENDLGTATTGATRLRLGQAGNWNPQAGYTGHNVIIGDVDSGVDWSHGDFLNPDGSSRILYLWDAENTANINTPEDLFGMTGFDYGRVWTKAEIDAGLCTEIDDTADYCHGTHTLGTAAGNGGATGNYTGMAPNADIICVKGLDPWGNEFIFEMARRLGRPAVVNNSWGISWLTYGPRSGYVYLFPGDGTDDYSQYFSYVHSIYPSGAIIVKSAGNNGMWQTFTDYYAGGYPNVYNGSLHFGGTTTQGTPISHVYHRISHSFGLGKYIENSNMMIRSDVPVSVRVTLANGTVCTMNTGGSGTIPGANTISTQTLYNLNQGQDPYNHEYMGYMRFDVQSTNQARHFVDGDWTIQVTPLNAGDTVNYDVWLYSLQGWLNTTSTYRTFKDSCFTTNSSHDEYQLDWAASRDAITTGAWTTRNEWLASDGYTYYYTLTPDLNTISYFSSPGPTRDGRMKPDIAAPGAVIISTLAGNYDPGAASRVADLEHQVMQGTSMAAPHTTGATALILQKYPNANTNQVRRMLQNWARNDNNTAAIGRDGFGAGKLNILPLNERPVAVVSVDNAELVLDNGDKATFDGSASYDPENFSLSFKWSLVAAPAGAAPVFSPSGNKAVLDPDPDLEGTYQVGLVVNDGIVDSTMAVVSVIAKFYPVLPPAAAALQRLESNFIFYKEYVNKLTWAVNAENRTAITATKIYRKVKGTDDSSYSLLVSLAPTVYLYEDKGLAAAQLFTYRITSVNSRGKESDPVVVGN